MQNHMFKTILNLLIYTRGRGALGVVRKIRTCPQLLDIYFCRLPFPMQVGQILFGTFSKVGLDKNHKSSITLHQCLKILPGTDIPKG